MQDRNHKLFRTGFPAAEVLMLVLAVVAAAVRDVSLLPGKWVYNIFSDFLGMLISFLLTCGILSGKNPNKKFFLFVLLCGANFLCLFFDYTTWITDGLPGMPSLVIAANTAYYIGIAGLGAMYAYFVIELLVSDSKEKRIFTKILGAVFFAAAFSRILNTVTAHYFYVDENAVYHRGDLYLLSYADIALELGMILIVIIRTRHSGSFRQRVSVLLFSLFVMCGALLLNFAYGISVMHVAVLISLMVIYSYFYRGLEFDRDRIVRQFGKYVSEDVVRKLLNDEDGMLEPGNYTGTVMVTDLRGFTAISENMDPASLVTMLNHYLGVITGIVTKNGGLVMEFLGDGIMCLFGAPTIYSDHADRAVASALEIQKNMPEVCKWNAEHGFPKIETGIGVNTGMMTVGSLGNEMHTKYTAVGRSVDRAFEIESCSVGGQVLVSNATLRAAKSALKSRFILSYKSSHSYVGTINISEVYHIGEPWNVGEKREIAAPRVLTEPLPLYYTNIVGKHVARESEEGLLIKISKDAIVLRLNKELHVLDDIRIDFPELGLALAKVEQVDPDETFAVFTSRPTGYEDWLNSRI